MSINRFSYLLFAALFLASACQNSDTPIQDNPSESVSPESPLPATASSTAGDIVSEFETFVDKQGISAGAIAVSFDGEIIASSGINKQASDSAPVASLSKAITAICTAKALQQSGVSYSATLGELIPQLLIEYAPDLADERIRQITLGQLITHTSGLQTPHLSVLGSSVTSMQIEQKHWQFEFIANDGLAADPGSGYYYANANYLILGLVIEQLTGEDYESWCNTNVLKPLSITSARLSPLWTILSAYGGWEISPLDYVRFIDAYFLETSVNGEAPDALVVDVPNSAGAFYGLGSLMRSTTSGYVYWHNGSFVWQSIQQSGRFGSYFAAYANGFTVSVNIDTDLGDGLGAELDSILYIAAHQ